jgi:hypothetical protein
MLRGTTLIAATVAALYGLTAGGCDSSDSSALPKQESAAEACTRITGCLGLSMDDCANTVLGRRGFPVLDPAAVESCVSAAKDCDAVGRCINGGQTAGSCDPTVDTKRCDGAIGRKCLGGVWVGLDCGKLGLECLQDGVKQLWCGKQGACKDATCHKDGVLSCVNKVMAFRSCGAGSCVDVNGTKTCAGEGPACQPSDFRCDGNTAVSCVNGKEHREPCAVCSDVDGAFCTKDSQCDKSSCDGATLKACVDGVPFDKDCTALGFSTCKEDSQGAHCAS